MDFNKCARCGCFFSHSGKICPNCISKDSAEIQKLENYLADSNVPQNIEQLAHITGITTNNLNRHIKGSSKFNNLNTLFNVK